MVTPVYLVLVLNVQSPIEEKGYSWKTVVEAFADKDLSEDVALENARLAKILTASDYDFDKQQPISLVPAADYRVDDGAGSKDEKVE